MKDTTRDSHFVKVLREEELPDYSARQITLKDITAMPSNCYVIPMRVLKKPQRIKKKRG